MNTIYNALCLYAMNAIIARYRYASVFSCTEEVYCRRSLIHRSDQPVYKQAGETRIRIIHLSRTSLALLPGHKHFPKRYELCVM